MADAESEAGTTIGAASSASGDLSLEVVVDKPTKCKMCRSSSDEESPFSGAAQEDRWGGFRPWGHYSKVYSDAGEVVGRRPDGKLCLPCINVFSALGLCLIS